MELTSMAAVIASVFGEQGCEVEAAAEVDSERAQAILASASATLRAHDVWAPASWDRDWSWVPCSFDREYDE